MGLLKYPDRPAADLAELGRHVSDLVPQLERQVIEGETIGTAETSVAHGLKVTPRMVHVTPRADARVWRSTAPDSERVYLTASASVVCDIEVVR